MYIKNRRNSAKFKVFGSYQTLCLTESFVLRNRLLFIYKPLCVIKSDVKIITKNRLKMKINIAFYCVFIIVFSLLYSCDCNQNVSGIVLDKETNLPIEKATIQKLNGSYNVFSSEKGEFKISAISGGVFKCPPMKIIVSKDGFFLDTLSIENSKQKKVYLKQKKWFDEYCKNELELIKPENELKILDLKLNSNPDSLLNIIKKELQGDFCYQPREFGIEIDNIPIKVSIFKECPELNLKVKFFSKTSMHFNDKRQVFINYSNVIELDSLTNYLTNNYPETGNKYFNNTIVMYWTDKMDINEIDYVIKQIIRGYLYHMKNKSELIYNKKICNLNEKELIELKKQTNFELELGTITENSSIIID